MKKIFKILSSRLFLTICIILVQAVVFTLLLLTLSSNFAYVYGGFIFISLIMLIWIINNNSNPSTKLPWIVLILVLPIFGGLFYICFGSNPVLKKKIVTLNKHLEAFFKTIPENNLLIDEIATQDRHVAGQAQYIQNVSSMPIYKNTITKYLSPGEVKLEYLLAELKKAKHYIFMEYFIIQEGKMWNSILDILVEKAKEGVDVRVMYDDIGCVNTLPYKYNEYLISLGIKCVVFNPLKPELSASANNRDHRKIAVIDGYVGFLGGINLADEYINEFEKHGHWKDCAVMLKGEAVASLTVMFLGAWSFYSKKTGENSDFDPYAHFDGTFETDGYVQPYMDSPLDDDLVGESVYINIINNSVDYVYINTPYLVVDNELISALCLAAKRGVDVKITTPYVADKWFVHIVTQAYYPVLIASGVKIYEYTPGFVHSKTFVSDDILCTIGTTNLDYRSLYHHFECGALFYKSKCVMELKEDYLYTLELCTQYTLEMCQKTPWYIRCIRSVIRVFAPLI